MLSIGGEFPCQYGSTDTVPTLAEIGSEIDEIAADAVADAFCVSPALLDAFIACKPFIATRNTIDLAAQFRVHPGFVAGRVQDKTRRYRNFNIHLARMRAILMAHAPTDGAFVVGCDIDQGHPRHTRLQCFRY